jgi:Rha family phage regulatory protein
LEVKTGKRHDNILRDIDSIKRSEQNFGKLNFEDSSYKQFTQTREYLFYWMTEDGFSVLMGGYSIAHRIEIQKELRLYKDGLKGSYLIEDPIKRAYKWIEEQQERQKAIETVKVLELDNKIKDQTIKEYTPKVSYYDLILQSVEAITITVIAKDYGLSAIRLNDFLHRQRVQYKQDNTWLLYQKYVGCGYTKTKTHSFEHSDGRKDSKIHTYWTQRGRLFLDGLLRNNGFIPVCERD